MASRWIVGAVLLGGLAALVLFGLQGTGPTAGSRIDSAEALKVAPQAAPIDQASVVQPSRQTRGIPEKVRDLFTQLEARHGEPLPGYVGGRDFQNRERRLPRGRYREYDVNPKLRGRPRDGERIVIEQQTGKAYYSADHYRTFSPLN